MTSQTRPLSNTQHLKTGFEDAPPTTNNDDDTDNAYQIKLPNKLVNDYSITTNANVKACGKFTPEDFGVWRLWAVCFSTRGCCRV